VICEMEWTPEVGPVTTYYVLQIYPWKFFFFSS
jgi:hypothetical protein